MPGSIALRIFAEEFIDSKQVKEESSDEEIPYR